MLGMVVLALHGHVGHRRGAPDVYFYLRNAIFAEIQGFKSILVFVRERFFSFALVLGVGFLLLVSLCINAGLAAAGTALSGHISVPEWIAQATSTLVSLFDATGLFGLVYKIIPDVDLEWRDVALGAPITSLLYCLETRGRHVSRKNQPRLHLWRRRLLGGVSVLGVLFHPHLLSWGGIHPSLC